MTTPERVAQMFAAIDDEGRRYVMAILQFESDRVQAARRPFLRLIEGGSPPAAFLTTACAPMRFKNKEA